jgi:hypothetical protein
MATKRKVRKRRRGSALRMPSAEISTPAKFTWAPQPLRKVDAKAAS